MAHNTRLRSPGFWTLASVVTEAEFELFDQRQFEAINGDLGGTWAPSTRIEIGGAGLKVNELEVSAYAEFGGDVSFQGPLVEVLAGDFQVGCEATFDNDVTLGANGSDTIHVKGGLDVDHIADFAGSVTFHNAVEFAAAGGVANFKDQAIFEGTVTTQVGAAAIFNDSVQINGALDVNFPADFSQPITLSGGGHVRKRFVAGANADTTYGVNQYDIVQIADSSLTANRTYTVSSTGAAAGSMMRFHHDDATSGFWVEVRRASDGVLLGRIERGTINSYEWIDIVFDGAKWVRVGHYYHTA